MLLLFQQWDYIFITADADRDPLLFAMIDDESWQDFSELDHIAIEAPL